LAGDSKDEVFAGFEILKSLNMRRKGAILVACPSCGRADVDVVKLANEVDNLLRASDKNVTVAVMGCEVNGPGEAKDADVGIAAGAGRAIIFRKGVKVKVVAEEDMLTALMEEVENTPVAASSTAS
jgi:(E)-4-hydroxy-3-methylbut-2-enyl-diphosphate synthase